jgi:L-seryl-tRNA(Ser) seleniumtransferase
MTPRSRLPAIHALLTDPRLVEVPRPIALRAAREVVAEARAAMVAGDALPDDLLGAVLDRVVALREVTLRPVINATGVVLHTNLGRAPMAPEAVAAVSAVAGVYSTVEMRLGDGQRGGRLAGVAEPLRALTGAEDAIAVNNNAAAVFLAVTALGRGRSVVVSRGELVEIGGSFRVPDVISAGGARLVEVGTTNRTRVGDYAAAMDADTAVLLRVHPSNFKVLGFTERPDRAGLVALGEAQGVPVVEDLGSGLIGPSPIEGRGLEEESVDAALAAGVGLVCFSGDKLLGGPQAGLLVGRKDLVQACRNHPLYRALRLGKLALAALEATLRLYADGRGGEVPVHAMLSRSRKSLRGAANRIAAGIDGAHVETGQSVSGGGALPGEGLETALVVVTVAQPDALAAALRAGDCPVVARVAGGALVLDPRTLLPEQEAPLIAALRAALAAVDVGR